MSFLRIQIAGGLYHLLSRGADRRRIYVDDHDYETYLRLLAAVVVRNGWRLYCFCLMPNHMHLVVETPEPNLANGMQWLHSRYAMDFNKRHHRVGHLFEAAYKSPLITDDLGLVRTVRYVVMNPVAAALSRRAADWPWGSHSLVAHRAVPSWLGHERLEERFAEIAGPRLYDRLIAAGERDQLQRLGLVAA